MNPSETTFAVWEAWITAGMVFFIVGGAAGMQVPMTMHAKQAQRGFSITCLFATLVCFGAAATLYTLR